MTETGGKRKVWTKSEKYLFLACYKARKDEFEHPRKRKIAYENVLEDMVFNGLKDENVTPISLERKMRTLLDAYKAAKDNSRRTGASPCPGSYMDEMEELFGRKAIVSHSHALDVGLHNKPPLEDETDFYDVADNINFSQQITSPTTSSQVTQGESPETAKRSFKKL